MDASTLLQNQLDRIAGQLAKVTAGVTEAQADLRPISNMMTLRESVIHLADCYVAAKVMAEGGTPEFGSFVLQGTTWNDQVTETFALRKVTIDEVLGSYSDQAEELLTGFVILHDAYHVGQMASVRNATDPEWSSYALYA